MSGAMRSLLRAAMALALMAVWLPARAQSLVDPTQPPPEARLATPGAEAAAPALSGPQLQSVLIGTRGRQVAVIDGQTLRKGDKLSGGQLHGAVLAQIGKNHVVLQHGRARRTLTLFPDTGAEAKAVAKAAAHTRAPTH